jgi:hypothetical protein
MGSSKPGHDDLEMRLAFAQSDLLPGIEIESHAIQDWMSWAPDMMITIKKPLIKGVLGGQ